ncbi:MAG: ABC transporter ATP-binding protein [Ruminococcaceae bacterium]|nr:ABC transporter ATP-binding protein [Oscillospiraceae bacterium]
MKKKNNNITLIKSFMRGCTHFFVFCIIASLLASLCELIMPKIISFTVDSVIGSEEVDLPAYLMALVNKAGGMEILRENSWVFAVLVLVFAVLMGIFKYLETVFNRKGSETLVETMRNRLFSHIERLPFSWYMKNQTGDIIQRCTSDVDMIKMFLSEQLTTILSTFILIVMSLVFMFSISTPLALIALVSIPIIIGYSLGFHRYIGDGFEKCDEHEGKLSAICQENLTGVRVVRAFGREKYEVDKYKKQNDIYTNSWVKLGKVLAYFWCTGDIITGVQVMVILVVGTVLCVNGKLTVGDLIAILSYNAMLTWPVRSLGRVISEMSKAGISIGRINDIMSAEEESDRHDAVDCDTSGDIVFDHVTFSYDGSTKILDDVSLTIKKGSTVGILGMTGSGKSTLVSLLCRLYETSDGCGTVSISGTDVRRIKSDSLRKNVGIVLQEPFLFSRTLGENIGITFDDPAARMEEIREAARAACLDETIEGFSAGYDTTVGERGVTLSGGQKQRTAIARLLAQKTPVMIFDDSLSAVDSETDAKIRHALREKTADSTVIIISHRIQTLMSADNIVVMSGGRIIESGTHDELIALGGTYKKINDIQSSGLDENEEVDE